MRYAKIQILLTSAACAGLLITSAARAATIGYWEFDDQAPGNLAGTLASQANSPDLDGTATTNGTAVKPSHSADRPNASISDGLYGPLLHTNTASLRFTNPGAPYTGSSGSNVGSLVNVQDPVTNDNLLEPAGDFTIEGFVKINSHVGFATLIGKERSGGNASWVLDTSSNGNLRLRVDSTDVIEPNPNQSGQIGDGVWNQGFGGNNFYLEDGQWHHFAMTYTASTRTVAIYGDYNFLAGGQLGDSGVMTYDDSPLRLGNLSGGRALDGWLDEIRLSSTVLSTDQFLRAIPTPAALPAGLALLSFAALRRRGA